LCSGPRWRRNPAPSASTTNSAQGRSERPSANERQSVSSSGGGSADLWRGEGTKSSSQVKPAFLRIFSACRAAASASPSWSEPNRPHTRASRCRSTSAVTLPQLCGRPEPRPIRASSVSIVTPSCSSANSFTRHISFATHSPSSREPRTYPRWNKPHRFACSLARCSTG
jgi:hypothetical protein